jgi:cysteine desulfuration protein SufE|tara:strand:+ start:4780 stop:5175 length:396 start_codon:yes stop_codon:yes gene_type:complete
MMNKIKEISNTLDLFPTNMMRLEYLVDLGKKSQKNYPEEERKEENFIHGCSSHAWILLINSDPIQINTVSDSVIVSGLLYILEMAFNGEPKSSIDNYDPQELITDLGLGGHISSQRLRGFDVAIKMMQNRK